MKLYNSHGESVDHSLLTEGLLTTCDDLNAGGCPTVWGAFMQLLKGFPSLTDSTSEK